MKIGKPFFWKVDAKKKLYITTKKNLQDHEPRSVTTTKKRLTRSRNLSSEAIFVIFFFQRHDDTRDRDVDVDRDVDGGQEIFFFLGRTMEIGR